MDPKYLTEEDYQRLLHLTQALKQQDFSRSVNQLRHKLRFAQRFFTESISPKVVTMNSRVRVMELKSSSEMTITIVYPPEADFSAGKISILSHLGTAVLGNQEGDEVFWTVPYCKFIYRIKEVLYQPKASSLLT